MSEKDPLDTPMMRQYRELKDGYPDAVLFFRMGDFYEMFQEDAIEASKILDITLTQRQNQIPMAGIPYHAVDSYIPKLLGAGKKIVICEQEKTNELKPKLLSREVVRIITPGTVIEENLLGGYKNNYLGLYFKKGNQIYLGFADVSTSQFQYFLLGKEQIEDLEDLLKRFSPKEILYPEGLPPENLSIPDQILLSSVRTNIESEGKDVLIHLLEAYLAYNYRGVDIYSAKPTFVDKLEYLQLDEKTISNLELLPNTKTPEHSLFGVLNHCQTAVGKRTLEKQIIFPMMDSESIQKRQEYIHILRSNKKERLLLQKELSSISDLERLFSRFRGGRAIPRDFRSFEKFVSSYKNCFSILQDIGYAIIQLPQEISDFANKITSLLFEGDLPSALGSAPFLKSGNFSEYDTANLAKTEGKDWIINLEKRERENSKISTLKIRYNKILGYYIELSRNQAKEAPQHFLKKQTLVTTERFTSIELEELERKILIADETIDSKEREIFDTLVEETLSLQDKALPLAQEIGMLDYLLSLCLVSERFQWTRPTISDNKSLSILDGRHPVVEANLPIGERFIANSLNLDSDSQGIAILTGPNMAGKSTYMRQVALIQILFQMGSFVPASQATLPLVDQIFTRIGSGDNIASGESTFYVEMKETAYILKKCTSESLILFDEVGRGTSTYDGLSIAWSILDHLAKKKPRPKTIFATHYHELTEMGSRSGIFNLYLDTYEKQGEVLFLKKVKTGKAQKSFGLYVAKIAGIPSSILEEAHSILKELEKQNKKYKLLEEPSLFDDSNLFREKVEEREPAIDLIRKLEDLNLDDLTPLQALLVLEEWKSQIRR